MGAHRSFAPRSRVNRPSARRLCTAQRPSLSTRAPSLHAPQQPLATDRGTRRSAGVLVWALNFCSRRYSAQRRERRALLASVRSVARPQHSIAHSQAALPMMACCAAADSISDDDDATARAERMRSRKKLRLGEYINACSSSRLAEPAATPPARTSCWTTSARARSPPTTPLRAAPIDTRHASACALHTHALPLYACGHEAVMLRSAACDSSVALPSGATSILTTPAARAQRVPSPSRV